MSDQVSEFNRNSNMQSGKHHEYASLIQAIDYFSQKLNIHQIFETTFNVFNQLLSVQKSAIYIKENDDFVLKESKSVECGIKMINRNKCLDSLASLHGTLIHDSNIFLKYFEPKVYEQFDIALAVPLTFENILYGFIFLGNKTTGQFNSEDYVICESIMRLANSSIENYKRYEEINNAKIELDEKIFNLFAINHSSKALLSELNLESLYQMSIDVFSELTQSIYTGFVLYNEASELYELKAYRDVFLPTECPYYNTKLNPNAKINTNKYLLDIANTSDLQYIEGLFSNSELLITTLKPLYIVLLVKDNVLLGFVTLGKTITGSPYKKSVFELVESLASSTYIAISNAKLFKEVKNSNEIIQSKLVRLMSLNNLMANINSASDYNTLIKLAMKTIEVSFGVDKSFFACYDSEDNSFRVESTLNVDLKREKFKPKKSWDKVFDGYEIFMPNYESIPKYIGSLVSGDLSNMAGILIIPVYIEKVDIELLGVFVIFKYKDALLSDEEMLLIMKTVSNHIAPVMNNLITIEKHDEIMIPNYPKIFLEAVKKEISEAEVFKLELSVLLISHNVEFSFDGSPVIDKVCKSFDKAYRVSFNKVFVPVIEPDNGIEETIENMKKLDNISVSRYDMGKDFKTFEEFKMLFSSNKAE